MARRRPVEPRPVDPAEEAAARAALDELYASLPSVQCKGMCHDSCTAIDASELERRRLAERGISLPDESASDRMGAFQAGEPIPRCPALSPLNTCSVYDVRPLICRAFGVTLQPEAARVGKVFVGPLMCDYGCWPEGVISYEQLHRTLAEIEALSQAVTGVRRYPG